MRRLYLRIAQSVVSDANRCEAIGEICEIGNVSIELKVLLLLFYVGVYISSDVTSGGQPVDESWLSWLYKLQSRAQSNKCLPLLVVSRSSLDRWYDAGSTATNEVPDAVKLGNSSLARGNEIKLRQVVNSDLLIPVDLCQSMYDALSTTSFTLRVPVEYGVWCASMIDAGDVIEDSKDDHFDACVVRFGSLEGVCLCSIQPLPLWHG